MHLHLNTVTTIDCEQRKVMLFPGVGNLEKISLFREHVGAIHAKFFERMKTQGVTVKLCDLGGALKGKWQVLPSSDPTRSIIQVPSASMEALLPVMAVQQWEVVGWISPETFENITVAPVST